MLKDSSSERLEEEKLVKVENRAYLHEISKITGVLASQVLVPELLEMYRAHFTNARVRTQVPHRNKYGAIFNSDRLCQLVEAVADLPARVLSFGLFAPEYISMLESYKKQSKVEPVNVMLLGAQTTATIEEYAKVVHKVFPQATCSVVDIEKRNPGNSGVRFIEANALNLPRTLKQKFDIVTTNALVMNLRGTEDRWDIEGNKNKLLANAHKILRSGGALLMIDAAVGDQGHRDSYSFEKGLKEAGFTNVSIGPAKQISTRRHVDRVLRGVESISEVPQTTSPLDRIIAYKR